MIIWTCAVMSVLYTCVLYFCICTCSVQLSMFHMERRSRSTLIIIVIITKMNKMINNLKRKDNTTKLLQPKLSSFLDYLCS